MSKKNVTRHFLERELKDKFLICRDVGHNWKLQGFVDERRKWGTVERTFRCSTCTTERIERVGANTGDLDSRRYVYPPGYIIRDKDVRKGMKKSAVRVEALRRLVKGVSVG
jgi:hypothetical protein